MPFKIFTPKQLTAAEANTYFMQQAISTFADAIERSIQLTSPVEGQVTYLKDLNKLQYWDGTIWIAVGTGAGGASTFTICEIGP